MRLNEWRLFQLFAIQQGFSKLFSSRHPSSASLAGSEVPSSPAASPGGSQEPRNFWRQPFNEALCCVACGRLLAAPTGWRVRSPGGTAALVRLCSAIEPGGSGNRRLPASPVRHWLALCALSSSSHRGRRRCNTPPGTYTPAAKSPPSAMPSSPRCCAGSGGRRYRRNPAA